MKEKHISCINPQICKEFTNPCDECKKKKCKFAKTIEYEIAETSERGVAWELV